MKGRAEGVTANKVFYSLSHCLNGCNGMDWRCSHELADVPSGCRGPSKWGPFCCFPREIIRELDLKRSEATGAQIGIHTEYGHIGGDMTYQATILAPKDFCFLAIFLGVAFVVIIVICNFYITFLIGCCKHIKILLCTFLCCCCHYIIQLCWLSC